MGLRNVEQQIDEEVSALNGKIEITKSQLKSSREETQAIENKIDETRNEISSIHESVMKIKEEIIIQITNIDEDLHNQLANVRISSNSMNEKLQTNSMRIANHSEELDNHNKSIELHNHDIRENNISIKNLNDIKLNKEIYEKEMARSISEIQKIAYGQQDLHRNLQATDNYIEKYYPITLQNYITDTLSTVIDNKKILGRLLKYDMGLYKKLNQQIIDDEGIPSLNKQYFEVTDLEDIRRKIALIEDQEIKDDSDYLPSEYSQRKTGRRRNKRRNYDDSQSDTSKVSAGKYHKKRPGTRKR